jgi:hypothetical protein
MLSPHWFLRMSQWVRNPPSWGAFRFVLLIAALCALLVGFELIFGWPDALTPERVPRRGPPLTEL